MGGGGGDWMTRDLKDGRMGGGSWRRRGEKYRHWFVTCVDKYAQMSSLRESDGGVFPSIIIAPLSCNELPQRWSGTGGWLCVYVCLFGRISKKEKSPLKYYNINIYN